MGQLQERLGHRFGRPELLTEALTHRSVLHETNSARNKTPRPAVDNQRLEFFGDAVLQLVLTEEVFARFPKADEGHLTKLRARLANRHMLFHLAHELALGDHLALGKGEDTSGGRRRPSNLADAFESVVGALYLDGGYEAARRFLLGCYESQLARLEVADSGDNPKGELQEFLQVVSGKNPVYRIVSETGPDHNKRFEVMVEFEGRELGRGAGSSKKEAEMRAAEVALAALTTNGPRGEPPPADESLPQI
ncbi:MAG: ribonuclease III [Verrucomicrobia bacterium]|nr:ribonuclease III [Verrucomicrobiota bacterium]